jgi:hypothetical protein
MAGAERMLRERSTLHSLRDTPGVLCFASEAVRLFKIQCEQSSNLACTASQVMLLLGVYQIAKNDKEKMK